MVDVTLPLARNLRQGFFGGGIAIMAKVYFPLPELAILRSELAFCQSFTICYG